MPCFYLSAQMFLGGEVRKEALSHGQPWSVGLGPMVSIALHSLTHHTSVTYSPCVGIHAKCWRWAIQALPRVLICSKTQQQINKSQTVRGLLMRRRSMLWSSGKDPLRCTSWRRWPFSTSEALIMCWPEKEGQAMDRWPTGADRVRL
jgi:hypothetical protein